MIWKSHTGASPLGVVAPGVGAPGVGAPVVDSGVPAGLSPLAGIAALSPHCRAMTAITHAEDRVQCIGMKKSAVVMW